MNIVVTPARTTVFMDPGLRRDDEKPDQSKTIMLQEWEEGGFERLSANA